MSTFLQIFMLDVCMFNPNTSCGFIAHTLDDATTIFASKAQFAYDYLPDLVKMMAPLTKRNTTEMQWANGSSMRVGTSLRGGTLQYLHISEFGKIAARFPERAEEIVTGSLNTLSSNGHVFIESTAEGQSGRFFDMVTTARANVGKKLGKMDNKFFFFPWYKDHTYVLDTAGLIIPRDLDKYFTKLSDHYGIELSMEQKAWYVSKDKQMGEGMHREFPSHPDEAFAAAPEGNYYGSLMAQAHRQGRIGSVPFDPMMMVETHWDLGMNDSMVLWARQRGPGGELRYINYYENSGHGLAHYANVLDDWKAEYGYRYSRHIGPHDSNVRELGTGKTRKETAESLGMKPWEVAPSIGLQAGIEAVRNVLPKCYFDETRCEKGIEALMKYTKEWNDKLGTWSNQPKHDKYSHAADAFRTGAVAREPIDHEDSGFNVKEIKVPKFGAV
jgi:hypothetical protein